MYYRWCHVSTSWLHAEASEIDGSRSSIMPLISSDQILLLSSIVTHQCAYRPHEEEKITSTWSALLYFMLPNSSPPPTNRRCEFMLAHWSLLFIYCHWLIVEKINYLLFYQNFATHWSDSYLILAFSMLTLILGIWSALQMGSLPYLILVTIYFISVYSERSSVNIVGNIIYILLFEFVVWEFGSSFCFISIVKLNFTSNFGLEYATFLSFHNGGMHLIWIVLFFLSLIVESNSIFFLSIFF